MRQWRHCPAKTRFVRTDARRHYRSIPGYITSIKVCGSSRDLSAASRIHDELRRAGLIDHPSIATSLVEMYGRCGSTARARQVFDAVERPGVACWAVMAMAYAQNGHGDQALEVFARMEAQGLQPDSRCFIAALKACGVLAEKELCLERGMDLHRQLYKLGFESDIFVASTLVDMYAKCGSMPSSREVFDRMADRNTVAWNSIIMGYATAGDGGEALKLFSRMQHEGIIPDSRTFVAALKACLSLTKDSSRLARSKLSWIHLELERLGLLVSNTFVANTVVDMYSKMGKMPEARLVFDRIENKSLVSWNTLIGGYGQSGQSEAALEIFSRMRDEGFEPDGLTFIAAVNACSAMASREEGKLVGRELVKPVSLAKGLSVHSQLGSLDLENSFVANSLIAMYAKCGSLIDARRVFDRLPRRTLVSWNSMITGYVQGGEPEIALELFDAMESVPDARTYLAAINAIAGLAEKELGEAIDELPGVKITSLERGFDVHSHLLRAGFGSDKFIASALVDMYAKCGSMNDAKRVFDRMPQRDAVCWTVLILGYAQDAEPEKALDLLFQMQEEGYSPNALTFAAALSACIALADDPSRCLGLAATIHSQISKSGCESDVRVASALLDLYCKCGNLTEARRVFDRMEKHDVVSWTTLMLGHVHAEQGDAALNLFSRMQRDHGLVPDPPAFAAALKACASSAALDAGRDIHRQVREAEMEAELVVVNSLLGLYGRCGCMDEARQVFDAAVRGRDAVTWNAIIAGYCHQGDVDSSFKLFDKMVEDHSQPDGVTFLSLLTACCHAGLVDRGKELFRSMTSDYTLVPGVEHYSCMVDLLGRANQLEEALAVVTSIPVRPDPKLWMTVLDACGKWNNLEIGRVAFRALEEMDVKDSAAYVIMSRSCRGAESSSREMIFVNLVNLVNLVNRRECRLGHSSYAQAGHTNVRRWRLKQCQPSMRPPDPTAGIASSTF